MGHPWKNLERAYRVRLPPDERTWSGHRAMSKKRLRRSGNVHETSSCACSGQSLVLDRGRRGTHGSAANRIRHDDRCPDVLHALPGKEQEVLNIRLSACDVLEKNGVTRGRVLTREQAPRQTKNDNDPDVVWEGEFPDAARLKRYEEIAGGHPDFIAAVQKMRTVTRIPTERRYYQLRSGR